ESPSPATRMTPRAAGSGPASWNTVPLVGKPVRTGTHIGEPKGRRGARWRPLPTFCVGIASFVVVTGVFQEAGVAQPIQQPKGNAVIIGTLVDETRVPVARARVQAFSAAGLRKASNNSQRL